MTDVRGSISLAKHFHLLMKGKVAYVTYRVLFALFVYCSCSFHAINLYNTLSYILINSVDWQNKKLGSSHEQSPFTSQLQDLSTCPEKKIQTVSLDDDTI